MKDKNVDKLIYIFAFTAHVLFTAISVTIGVLMGKATDSYIASSLTSVVTVMFIYYMLSRKQQKWKKDAEKSEKGIVELLNFANKLGKSMDECIILDHPNLAPGWGCCKCRTYNSYSLLKCKYCGHERCCKGIIVEDRTEDDSRKVQ